MRQQTYSLYYYLFGVARVLRDDLLSRSIARAKATRSVSLLKLKARCAFNASSVASAPRPRERSTTFGAPDTQKPSKCEIDSSRLERYATNSPPNAEKVARVWSATLKNNL